MNRNGKAVWAAIVGLAVLAPQVFAQSDRVVGSFEYKRIADKMTDEDRSMIGTRGDDAPARRLLVWRCMEDGLNVAFDWDKYFVGNSAASTVSVQYRFPPAPMVAGDWDMSTNHEIGFVPMHHVQAFTAGALKSATVILRATDNDGETVTESFKLDGLAEGLKLLPCAMKTSTL